MTFGDVLAVMRVAEQIGPEAALVLRLAAATETRQAGLAALHWSDVVVGWLLIDSAIEVVVWGDVVHQVGDVANQTDVEQRPTLDPARLEPVVGVGGERERCGPWMFRVGMSPP